MNIPHPVRVMHGTIFYLLPHVNRMTCGIIRLPRFLFHIIRRCETRKDYLEYLLFTQECLIPIWAGIRIQFFKTYLFEHFRINALVLLSYPDHLKYLVTRLLQDKHKKLFEFDCSDL